MAEVVCYDVHTTLLDEGAMFDATQYATLRAVVDRMIPADDVPGGLDAGVDQYLLRFLQHDGAGYAATYLAGLDALQHEAQLRYRADFASLAAADADAILHAMMRGDTHAAWSYGAATTIDMFAEHCAEGFYADPRQGGNRNAVSWQMIGFEERR